MRNATLVRNFFFVTGLTCLLNCSFLPLKASAQQANPPQATQAPVVASPSDPKELLQLAAKLNSLNGDNLPPWHIKISYKSMDRSGNVTEQGSYEEFRVSPTKYKIIYTSPGVTETEYGTEKGIRLTGALDPAPMIFDKVKKEFFNPINLDTPQLNHPSFKKEERKIGSDKLTCITRKGESVAEPHLDTITPTYCFDQNQPALRAIIFWQQTHFNNPFPFAGRFLPTDVEAEFTSSSMIKPKPVFAAHLDLIEAIQPVNDSDFTPPAEALPPPRMIALAEEASSTLLLDHPKPAYPPIAWAARVQGSVVLKILIGVDGHVHGATVISGPAMLQQAAIDGVMKWTYKPYLLKGEALEVVTTVTVPFSLTGPRPF